jgi:uncharacterized membrane protein
LLRGYVAGNRDKTVAALSTRPAACLVLLHGRVSFGFNLMVLALTINLVASVLG